MNHRKLWILIPKKLLTQLLVLDIWNKAWETMKPRNLASNCIKTLSTISLLSDKQGLHDEISNWLKASEEKKYWTLHIQQNRSYKQYCTDIMGTNHIGYLKIQYDNCNAYRYQPIFQTLQIRLEPCHLVVLKPAPTSSNPNNHSTDSFYLHFQSGMLEWYYQSTTKYIAW